jgi:hypothetical protein
MLSEHVDRLIVFKGSKEVGRSTGETDSVPIYRYQTSWPSNTWVTHQDVCFAPERRGFRAAKKRHHGLKRTLIANARFARSKSAFQCPRARQHRPPAQLVQPKRLSSIGDRFVRQVMLVPDRVENAATAGKTKTENPGKVPHRPCSLSRDGRSCPRSAWRSLPRA